MSKYWGAFCLALIFNCGIHTYGQSDHGHLHRPILSYSSDSFSGTLGPHFMGNDLRQICEVLSKRIPSSKNEFETTAAYHARVYGEIERPIVGDIHAESLIAFVIPSPLNNHLDEIDDAFLTTLYDADTSQMTVWMHPSLTYQPGEPSDISSVLDRPEDLHSVALIWGANAPKYNAWNASNAFGASVKVIEQQYDAFGLAFDLKRKWQSEELADLLTNGERVSFSVPGEEAKLIKNRLRVLIVCQMKSIPLMSGTSYHKATMTEPNETTARYKYLRVTPLSLWIFDYETGKVYLKQDGDPLDTVYSK